ncbi:MAG TPA: bifunctional DNA-formamidopyrimidine glycosylase/DNA-(apurinic or apyrimidinic site) lyase [Mycobacteriales bacterium]|nr:bifunctional DNA-formamidopyrimidine glycosylase/DNA-(apurinic or apyrimidinic site) lyase [Mycobacteriales bacterium]
MPELPEVETVRRGLERWVVGRRIAAVEVSGERTLRRHPAGPADFTARMAGRTIVAACRRGKFLWLPLDDGMNLLAHLGMSGQFLAVTAAAAAPAAGSGKAPLANRHVKARWRFDDDGPELLFCDQRTFGGLALADDELTDDGVPVALGHVAPDPLEPAFDPGELAARLRRRRTGIKRALLDQTLVSGIGNIYADEALWRARLHFARGTDGLRRPEIERLLAAVEAVLQAAIEAGGTSFDALYVAVNGESGWFDRSLEAYGQEGRPCSRCGTSIVRVRFTNRSSYFCPKCQPRPRHGRW